MYPSGPNALLTRFFSGLTEQTFQTRLGVVDPPLIDYLAELLVRFVHNDDIFRLRNAVGRRLDEVAGMLQEAKTRIGDSQREFHRHIGDFTLFWTGVYPEALKRLQSSARTDSVLDYTTQGKRSYFLASSLHVAQDPAQDDLLSRLSAQFEMCAYGLGEVRREWERQDANPGSSGSFLIN